MQQRGLKLVSIIVFLPSLFFRWSAPTWAMHSQFLLLAGKALCYFTGDFKVFNQHLIIAILLQFQSLPGLKWPNYLHWHRNLLQMPFSLPPHWLWWISVPNSNIWSPGSKLHSCSQFPMIESWLKNPKLATTMSTVFPGLWWPIRYTCQEPGTKSLWGAWPHCDWARGGQSPIVTMGRRSTWSCCACHSLGTDGLPTSFYKDWHSLCLPHNAHANIFYTYSRETWTQKQEVTSGRRTSRMMWSLVPDGTLFLALQDTSPVPFLTTTSSF